MEDAHTQILSLENDKGSSFFAVYDGHGGAKVAEYAGSHLHNKIVTHPLYSENIFKFLNNITRFLKHFVFFNFFH